jgi:subtilisin family serine protease
MIAQNFVEGQLYVCVAEEAGIPDLIDQGGGAVLVLMDNSDLENYYNQFGVYSFERSFPIVDSFPNAYKYDLDKLYTLKCTGDEKKLMRLIQNQTDGIYHYVEQIPVYYPVHTPNDYHLLDATLETNWALDLINAEQAWNYTQGDPDIFIGISDIGFLTTHPDLVNKLTMVNTPGTPYVHGTAVAGCAGAETNNGIGTTSIGYDCSLMLFDAHNDRSHLWSGLLALANEGAKVLNASFAGLTYNESHQRSIYLMRDNGVLVVASAGNGTSSPFGIENKDEYRYPASYDGVISATSVYKNDSHDLPDGSVHTHNDKVDVCAPGYHVITTTFDNNYQPIYFYATGTSFASPIVAGLAGLIFSILPDAPPALAEAIIEMTCDDIDNVNPNYAGLLGNGRINAYLATQKAWNIANTSTQNIVVSNGQNITLAGADGIRVIDNYIKVETGGTLTISSKIFLKEGAKIIVEGGASLIIDGGLLTTYDNAYLWEGIELGGDVNEDQFSVAQGKITLKNDARIEYSKTAIKTFRLVNPFLRTYSGGIIFAENSTFYNNTVAIDMRPYENHHPVSGNIYDNLSYFDNVKFINSAYFYNTFENEAFVKISGVRGISFRGCDFKNLFGIHFSLEEYTSDLGYGIYSTNSSFIVDQICVDDFLPCNEYKPSMFNTLFCGVYAINTVSDKTFSIRNSHFGSDEDSSYPETPGILKGIYASGIDNISITDTEFELPFNFLSSPYGIYLDNCTDFIVTNNYLSLTGTFHFFPDLLNTHGIIINNSGVTNNIIYRNTFEDLNYGIQPQNENRGPRIASGLQLKCNNFVNCIYDITILIDENVTYNGIASVQGTSTDPAGNLFSEWNKNEYHIYNEGDPVNYWYHNNPLEYPVEPENNSSNIVTFMGYVAYSPGTSCPDQTGGGASGAETLLAEYEQANSDLNTLDQNYSLMLDDGNSAQLENEVESTVTSTAQQTKTELLGISPYVSETTLNAAINNEEAIDNGMLKDILIENPHAAKSEYLLYSLLDRQEPMPDNLMAEIIAGRFTFSDMETLLCNISKLDIKKGQLLNILINEYMADKRDSIRTILQEEGSLASVYKLVMMSLEQGEYTQGMALMTGIPSNFGLSNEEIEEYEDYLNLFSILANNEQFNNQPDSVQIIDLNLFMEETSGRPAAIARNFLVSSDAIAYQEPILKPNPFKSTGFPYDRFGNVIPDRPGDFSIYPNPAHNSITIEYGVKNAEDVLCLNISNLTGVTVISIPLDSSVDNTNVDISGLLSGMYICKITCNGKVILTDKLTFIY